MTVVSDASPLHYLVLIEAEHVLAELFSEVVVPPAVLRELSHDRAPGRVRQWAGDPPQWLRVMGPANVSLDAKLGDGEAEAIGLALERITTHPELHGRVYEDVRRTAVKRFPYSVFYRVTPDRIEVVAVFHDSRDPTGWQSRT